MSWLSFICNVVLFVHVCYCASQGKLINKDKGWSALKEPISGLTGLLTSTLFNKGDDYCEKVFQSPIDLPADATIASYGNIKFTGFQYSYETKLIIVDGVPEYHLKHSRHILISEGGLKGTYYLHKIRFFRPSQHTVAGARYFGEVHSIFINTKYSDYETASSYPDGLAILVLFAMIGTKENLAFHQYINALGNVDGDPPSYDLPTTFSPSSVLPNDRCSFFRYRGKYSQDSCKEIATWTLFTDTIEVTEQQTMDVTDEYLSVSEKFPIGTEHVITKLRSIDYDNFKHKSIVSIQPRIFCKTPALSKEHLPWYLFHKKF